MPSEQLRFWLEAAGSAAGIAALAAIALELLRARKADSRDFYFHVSERYEGLWNERQLLDSVEFSSLEEVYKMIEDKELLKAYAKVSNSWDLLARTVRDNPIDKKLAVEQFGRVFYEYYEKWTPVHNQLNEIEGKGGYGYFAHFDWFAAEYKNHLPGDWEAKLRADEHYENWKTQNS